VNPPLAVQRLEFSHAPPARLPIFERLADELDDADYWRSIRFLWFRDHAPGVHPRTWRRLLTADRPGREHTMHPVERRALAAMPEHLTLHRGYQLDRCRDGWSWTLDERVAWVFAHAFCDRDLRGAYGVQPERGTPRVVTATVARGDVIAYIGSDECEIVVNPSFATATRVRGEFAICSEPSRMERRSPQVPQSWHKLSSRIDLSSGWPGMLQLHRHTADHHR
jgi:hypothetical protein